MLRNVERLAGVTTLNNLNPQQSQQPQRSTISTLKPPLARVILPVAQVQS